MPTLEHLIATYGPLAVFVGTFLEGESIVVIAGFLGHQGVVAPLSVGICAFAGSFLGDQLWFYLGRRQAGHRWVVRLTQSPRFSKVLNAIENHPRKFILTFRFIYGIRTVSPVAIGLSKVSARTFAYLNAVSAAVWAAVFTAIGYLFGFAAERFLGEMKAIEHKLLGALAIALLVFVLSQVVVRLKRRRTQDQRQER
jgi:membrane protein DedA with SNARE-associated domain